MALVGVVMIVELLWVGGILMQAALAALAGMRLEVISFGYGPPLVRTGRVQVALFPLGGYVRIAGLHPTEGIVEHDDRRAFFNRALPLRMLVVLGWPVGAQLMLIALTAASFLVIGQARPAAATISNVMEGSPAEVAGLRAGDRIVAIDGRPALTSDDIGPAVRDAAGAPMKLEVDRGGERLTITVVPQATSRGYRLGIMTPSRAVARPGVIDAVGDAAGIPFAQQGAFLAGLRLAIAGTDGVELGGPSAMMSAISMTPGVVHKVNMLMTLAAILVLGSMCPLPPLPGGQLLFVLCGWRSRRGRAASTPARDLGPHWQPRPRMPLALLAPLLPIALYIAGSMFMFRGDPARAAPATIMYVLLGVGIVLRWPRAWAWGVYLPLLLLPSMLLGTLRDPAWIVAANVALLLVVPATMLLPPVRRAFARECPVCGRLAASPVRGSARTSCLACGSGWRRAPEPASRLL